MTPKHTRAELRRYTLSELAAVALLSSLCAAAITAAIFMFKNHQPAPDSRLTQRLMETAPQLRDVVPIAPLETPRPSVPGSALVAGEHKVNVYPVNPNSPGLAQWPNSKDNSSESSPAPVQAPQSLPTELSLNLAKGVKLDLLKIPPGTFEMGSPAGEKDRDVNETLHNVTISNVFYMAKYPITQEQYEAVTSSNPSRFSNEKGGNPKNPVEQVSWTEAVQFCDTVSRQIKTDLPDGMLLRLPTEAQWEYACRAGTKTRYYTGDEESDLSKAGWYARNSERKTHPVGQKSSNAFGLFDMHGNVWQWCQDGYNDDYEKLGTIDPFNDSSKGFRVFRGGSWHDPSKLCRSANHLGDSPGMRHDFVGFRVVVAEPLLSTFKVPMRIDAALSEIRTPTQPSPPTSPATTQLVGFTFAETSELDQWTQLEPGWSIENAVLTCHAPALNQRIELTKALSGEVSISYDAKTEADAGPSFINPDDPTKLDRVVVGGMNGRQVGFASPGNAKSQLLTHTVADDTFHHIVIIRSHRGLTLQIDGKNIATLPFDQFHHPETYKMRLHLWQKPGSFTHLIVKKLVEEAE